MSDREELRGLLEYAISYRKDRSTSASVEKFCRLTELTTPEKILELARESESLREILAATRDYRDAAQYQLNEAKKELESLRKDADRFKWLNRQRSQVWRLIAEMPSNHAAGYIDAAIEKERT